MDKKQIEKLLNQIISAANNITVRGEQNAMQVMGICRSAREVWRLVSASESEKKDEVMDNGG